MGGMKKATLQNLLPPATWLPIIISMVSITRYSVIFNKFTHIFSRQLR